MMITLNGVATQWQDGATVADLVQGRSGVAVAVNGQVVPRTEHALRLRTGDVVDVVTAVQGG